MHTEDLILYQRRDSKVVEQICTVAPDIERPILLHTFVVEAVDLCDDT